MGAPFCYGAVLDNEDLVRGKDGGQPVGDNSVLSNYQTVAFPGWGARFFNDIRINTNDECS